MNLLESPVGFLFDRKAILAIFVAITGINGALVAMKGESSDAWMISIMAVMTYTVLALFTYKRVRIVTIAMVFIMLFNGMGSLFESFRNLLVDPSHQTWMNLAALISGAYFIAGGLIIFKTRHDKD